MLDLLIAAALTQAETPAADSCNAAGWPQGGRSGCPAWQLVAQSAEGSGYLDPGSLQRDGDRVELTTRTLLNRPMEGGAVSILARVRLDCARRTLMIVLVSGWDPAGVRLFEGVPPDERPAPPARNSPSATMMRNACRR